MINTASKEIIEKLLNDNPGSKHIVLVSLLNYDGYTNNQGNPLTVHTFGELLKKYNLTKKEIVLRSKVKVIEDNSDKKTKANPTEIKEEAKEEPKESIETNEQSIKAINSQLKQTSFTNEDDLGYLEKKESSVKKYDDRFNEALEIKSEIDNPAKKCEDILNKSPHMGGFFNSEEVRIFLADKINKVELITINDIDDKFKDQVIGISEGSLIPVIPEDEIDDSEIIEVETLLKFSLKIPRSNLNEKDELIENIINDLQSYLQENEEYLIYDKDGSVLDQVTSELPSVEIYNYQLNKYDPTELGFREEFIKVSNTYSGAPLDSTKKVINEIKNEPTKPSFFNLNVNEALDLQTEKQKENPMFNLAAIIAFSNAEKEIMDLKACYVSAILLRTESLNKTIKTLFKHTSNVPKKYLKEKEYKYITVKDEYNRPVLKEIEITTEEYNKYKKFITKARGLVMKNYTSKAFEDVFRAIINNIEARRDIKIWKYARGSGESKGTYASRWCLRNNLLNELITSYEEVARSFGIPEDEI